MKIPYGMSDFGQIRAGGYFYADKTPFLPVLEEGYRYVVFLRPRRFGKSTLVSMLEHYYDVGRRDRWDALFGGLWVHEHPTPEQGAYLVLTLDFSSVATDRGEEAVRSTFVDAVRNALVPFLLRHGERFPALGDLSARLDAFQDAESLIGRVLGIVSALPHKLYLVVDEYDHFANRLLSAGEGPVYEAIVKKTGFVRTFYAALKLGTRTGALARMFVTGVSPLMLDDLSSGFNIATHASMDGALATLAGFTRTDTERAVDELLASRPDLAAAPGLGDRAALLDVLEAYYNGYRFSPRATQRVFNSDMVLYFLDAIHRAGGYPDNMLDRNVRTEYGHLQRIGTLTGADLSARRELLETILGEGHVRSEIVEQFGVASLASHTSFLSLLYYLGMLTLGTAPRDAIGYDLEIPNRVIRELQWEHLALMLAQDANVMLNVDDLRAALQAMAVQGDIQPFLDLFHGQVIQAFSNRDLRGLDEKTIKLLLLTYASLGRAFFPLSEKEFAQGYGDVFLGASRDVAGAKFSWLLELKYLKTGARPAQVEAAFAEAEAQVARYASDRALLPILLGDRALKAGMLVFVGAKRVLFRPWDGGAKRAPAKKAKKAGRRPPSRTPPR
jgi:Predicted AAA-ATPase/PD-(D/E)XK nuclease superfamily